mgnify:FL=1
MDFQEYEKDGVTITATETAYEVIYKAQGFRPKEEKPSDPVQNDAGKSGTKGGTRGGKAGSDPGDHGEGTPAGESQDA